MDSGEVRKGNGRLIAVLVVLGVIILGLIISIVVVNNNANYISDEERFGAIGSEQLRKSMDYYLLHNDDENADDLEIYLENQIAGKSYSDKKLDAIYYSALLKRGKSKLNESAELIEDTLNLYDAEIADQKKYELLSYLLSIYEEMGDVNLQKITIDRILLFPEDMDLKYENWSTIRRMMIGKLNKLNGGDGGE